MDEFGRIDTGPPPAVKSLRSKFEQLALETSQRPSPNPTLSLRQNHNNNGNDFLSPSGGRSSPRQRSTSGTLIHSPTDPEFHHLRTASSSSDLQFGINRAPPPPPPSRGPKVMSSPAPSPSPSPLLRPVPVPPGVSNGNGAIASPRLGFSSLPSASSRSVPLVNLSQEVLESPAQSFGSLRGKFGSVQPPKSLHSPRTSISNVFSFTDSGFSSATLSSSPKPAIPPRPSRPSSRAEASSMSPFLSIPQTRSSDEFPTPSTLSISPDPRASLHSPFSDDEDAEKATPQPATSALPILPARKLQTLSNLNEDTVRLPPPPPRPPPRTRAPTSSTVIVDSPTSSSSSISSSSLSSSCAPPPPLPARRSTFAQVEEALPKPRLPSRPSQLYPLSIPAHPESSSSLPSTSTPTERKALGSGRLPPPPTRTIALGEKLPPARRPPTPSSDDDSDDETDSRAPTVDSLPDSSQSSRRPPVLSFREVHAPQPRIQVPTFTGHICVAGTMAVTGHHHHVRMFDLVVGDVPMHSVDTREAGMSKDGKITNVEFRSYRENKDRGCIVWAGTKEGSLMEIDTRSGAVIATRWAAHLHPVTHIFRCGRAMVTLDDFGKVLIWAPETMDGEDIDLVKTHPRATRIAEKQDFVKMVGGKLWTAARGDQVVVNGTAGGAAAMKVPVLRVYDVFKLGSVMKTVMPTEHVGAVTSGTIIPLQPEYMYIGHEEGFVSVWLIAGDDGFPRCVEVMKVSTSDVLCLEGVNDRLWAGGRSGLISVYDTTQKPWVVTNCWNAHDGLPVMKLAVDVMGIEKTGRLCVLSVGRDQYVHFWDGLLGLDWVEEDLLKREKSFSNFRELTVLLVSWNCDSARPDSLTGDPANVNFLTDALHSVDSPDIVSFGFQEVIDLESRRMAAKNVLLGSKKGQEGGLSDKVTGAYKRWHDRLVNVMRQAMPPDVPYTVVHTESLVGLFTCVFVKHTERMSLRDIAITTVKRGMGGRYGNKGGIVARFVLDDSSICLINCHLAAGQNHVRQRNADVAGMLEEKSVFPETDLRLAYIGGGDGSMVLDHEIVFVNGDMNYRIDHRREAIVNAVRANDLATLLSHDQLLREIKFNRACRFRDFSEGPITFMPTYKYDPFSDDYDTSEKRRSPAWCDRVLWRTRDPSRVRQLHYQRYEANVSDHRPISAAFTITVKSVKHEMREMVKKEVEGMWMAEQIRLLLAAREFYVREALV